MTFAKLARIQNDFIISRMFTHGLRLDILTITHKIYDSMGLDPSPFLNRWYRLHRHRYPQADSMHDSDLPFFNIFQHAYHQKNPILWDFRAWGFPFSIHLFWVFGSGSSHHRSWPAGVLVHCKNAHFHLLPLLQWSFQALQFQFTGPN